MRTTWKNLNTNSRPLVIGAVLSILILYKVLASPVEFRTQFLPHLIGWNLVSLSTIMLSTWIVERRFLCDWFRCNFLKIAVTRILIYFSLSAIVALATVLFHQTLLPGLNTGSLFWSSYFFYLLLYFATTVTMEVSKLVGKGFTEKIILGKYHSSKKEERIFLFIDLKESTKLSKELPLDKYSLLIKEFFRDIEQAIQKFDGEIYQYAGDQVIATWPSYFPNHDYAARSFLEFYKRMKSKRPGYIEAYGVAPRFKAAIHSGEVIATWVGRMKRELVFQGEVLNIAAKLIGLAKNLSYTVILSDQVVRNLNGAMRKRILNGGSYAFKDIKMPMLIHFLRLEESIDNFERNVESKTISEEVPELVIRDTARGILKVS